MTITNIDKQLKQSRLWKEGGNSFECSDYEGICDDMKKLVHKIYSQAKAEQREEDARIVEKYNELITAVGNKYPNETRHETALRYIRDAEKGDDISKQIRSGNELRKGKV